MQYEQTSLFDQDMPFGKTSPEHTVPTKEKTSELSSKNSAKLLTAKFQFLDLRKASGAELARLWETPLQGGGYSVAWRTLDAQYWGVPQRRRRIWLVADFGGESAPEILFKREGLRRNFKESRAAWEGTASNVEGSVGSASATSLTAVVYAIGNGQAAGTGLHDKVESLNCMHDAQAVIAIDRAAFNQGENAQYDIGISENGIAQTVVAKGPGAAAQRGKKIRRLTPTECAKLQGMPSWWCADVPHSDSAEYKMWGNGMALPNALYVMEGFIETKEAKND